MKRKIFLLPIALLGILFLVTWGCTPVEAEVCEMFEVNEQCEIPNICCPEGEPCYYEFGDSKFFCDPALATDTDKDGCNQAENQIIAVVCPESKEIREQAVVKLRFFTKQLMDKVRNESVCM